MTHKRIPLFFLALSLMHISSAHAVNPVEYIISAFKSIRTILEESPKAHILHHPFVFVPISIATIITAAFIVQKIRKFKEFINTEPLEYDIIRGYSSNVEHIAIDIKESKMSTIESNIPTDKTPILSPVDADELKAIDPSIEQKTLVTVEITPLYGQSDGSYDVYIQ